MQPLFDMNAMLGLEIKLISQTVQLRCVRGEAAQHTVDSSTSARSRPSAVRHARGTSVGFLRSTDVGRNFPHDDPTSEYFAVRASQRWANAWSEKMWARCTAAADNRPRNASSVATCTVRMRSCCGSAHLNPSAPSRTISRCPARSMTMGTQPPAMASAVVMPKCSFVQGRLSVFSPYPVADQKMAEVDISDSTNDRGALA